jgi:RecA-family ATPase
MNAPHSIELEQALLGAVLCDNAAFHAASGFMKAQDLYEPIHQAFYETAAALIAAGRRADPIAVYAHLQPEAQKFKIGELSAQEYIGRLAGSVLTTTEAAHYARDIVELARKRAIIAQCEDIRAVALNGGDPGLAIKARDAFAEIAKTAIPTVAIVPTQYRYRPPSEIPAREWLHARHYLRGAVTATVAPGGYTKSTRSLTELIAMATTRNLLGEASTSGPLRVWYWNGEEPRVEIERKIAGICKRYGIDAEVELGGLFYDSGHDMPIKIASAGRGGPGSVTLNEETIKQIMAAIINNQIDVAVFDPFISVHSVAEGDNVAIDQVVKSFGRIAAQTGCAIDLDHHTRKPTPGQTEITVDDARGGGAIVYAARSCRIINRMSQKEADDIGFSPVDRLSYFRIDKPKANHAPPEAAAWCRVASVTIDNGDDIGVPEPWTYPNAFEDVTAADMNWVRTLVASGTAEYRDDVRASNWIGIPLAERLDLDLNKKPDRAKVKRILKTWFQNKVLDTEEREDTKRMKRKFVVLGTWKPEVAATADDGAIDL